MTRSNIRALTIWGIFTGILISVGMYLTFSKPHLASSSTSTWVWPLAGGVPIQGTLFNTTVENTDYGVKNLDLVRGQTPRITCFGVGFHSLYHAGVDLYVPDLNGNNVSEGNPVVAVSEGYVSLKEDRGDGITIVINHSPFTPGIYSAYWHLGNVSVQVGTHVFAGTPIGALIERDYSGRFPDVHPFLDDAHLHFEIRTNGDLSDAFPGTECNELNAPYGGWPEGVGYTYPNPPEAYGFLDPIPFLSERINLNTSKVYLPAISKGITSSTCQPNQDLLVNGNSGFEGPTVSPAPWIEISTYFDPYPNLHYYYHIVEEDSYQAYSGNHSAFLGNQVYFAEPVDEQLLQSIIVPKHTETLTWQAYLKLNRDYSGGYEDKFTLSLRDAATGKSLADDVVIDFGFPDPQLDGNWMIVTVAYDHIGSLANKTISLSYTGFANGDVHASTLRVDEVTLRTTTCDPNPQGGQINVNVNLQAVSGTPTPTPIPPSPTPTQTPAPTAIPTITPTPTATVPVDQYEPNNSYGQTKDFGTRSSLTINDATISTPNDEDWFEFDVPAICAHCIMQVSLSMIPSGANYDLELYGDDPITPLAYSHHLSNLNENLEFEFWDPQDWGSFRLRIFSVSGASLSPYHLQMNVVSNLALIYEPNNSFRDAYALSNGTANNLIEAALYPATDEDWFKLSLNPTFPFPAKGHQILTLQLSVPAGADYELALFNEQGVLLTTSIHTGNAPEYISFQVTQAGWYYIRVYPSANAEQTITEPYTLAYQYQP